MNELPKTRFEKRQENKQRQTNHRVPRPMTEKQRARVTSPEHLAKLRENWAKRRERNGGKVPNRRGVPNGWGKQGKRLRQIRAEAAEKAAKILEKLLEQGIVKKDAAGNEALKAAVEVVIAKDTEKDAYAYTVRDRLQAAKLVLDFTMEKPVAQTKVTVQNAESFLDDVLNGTPKAE